MLGFFVEMYDSVEPTHQIYPEYVHNLQVFF